MADKATHESTLRLSRNFLLRGYSVEYRCKIPCARASISPIGDNLFRALSPLGIFDPTASALIQDIKGCDAALLHELLPSSKLIAHAENLVSARGFIPAIGKDQEDLDFSVQRTTHFHEFEGSRHITHRIEEDRTPDIIERLPLAQIWRWIPLKVDEFLIGLDFFRAGTFTGFLGITPTVRETLVLHWSAVSGGPLTCIIRSEGLASKDSPPLATRGVFQRLDEAYKQTLGFSLLDDYRRCIAKE